jgi:mRNA interferase MazF
LNAQQERWSTGVVLPTSTSAQASAFRPEVVVDGRQTRILVDQIRTIDTQYICGDLVDFLNREDMEQVEYAVVRYLGLLA